MSSKANSNSSDSSDFSDSPESNSDDTPSPFEADLVHANPYPTEALGTVLQGAVDALTEHIQAPEAMCAQSVLAGASLAVQALADVDIDGRIGPLSEYFLTVAESGERKTTVDRFALHAHYAYQEQLSEVYLDELKHFENLKEAFDSAKTRVLRKGTALSDTYAAIEALGESPFPPQKPVLITGDFTLEGVQKILVEGRPTLGVMSDEGGTFLGGHSMLRENRLKTVAGLSSFWDGANQSRVRSGDGLLRLFGCRVTLHLMVQPMVASVLLDDDLVRNQGLLSRCLIVWPRSRIGIRMYREGRVNENELLKAYWNCITELLSITLPTTDCAKSKLNPRPLKLALRAKRTWSAFHDDVERAMSDGCEFASIRAFASKAGTHSARIAGILALVEDPYADSISETLLEQGIELLRFYLWEHNRIANYSARNIELDRAKELLTWIHQWTTSRGTFSISTTEINQYGPNRFRGKSKFMPIVEVLIDYQCLQPLSDKVWHVQSDDQTFPF